MKTITRLLGFLLACMLLPLAAQAQFSTIVTNYQFNGATNQLNSGATWTWVSGSTMNFKIGGATTNNLLYVSNTTGTVLPLGLGAGLSISGGNLVASGSTIANPTAVIGLTAVNGSASTLMRSDAAPALSQAIVPTWTGLHTFSVTSAVTSGSDWGLKITPTLNQRNNAAFSALYINETITQAGSGLQYLIQSGVGATDFFDVDTSGNVTKATWTANVIGAAYGGAGTTNGFLYASGTGAVSAGGATNGVAISGNNIILASIGNQTILANITGSTNSPSANTLTGIMDAVFGNTQGAFVERGSGAWQAIGAGTSGQFLRTNGAGADPSWVTISTLVNPMTTTGDIIYSSSGSSAARLGIGSTNQILTVVGGIPAWANAPGGGNVSTSGSITSGQTPQWNGTTTLISVANTGTGSYVLATSPTITTPTISGAITFPTGVRQTFAPNATNAGLNFGSVTSTPSGAINGDSWYNSTSGLFQFYQAGSVVALGTGGGGTPGGSNTYVQFNNSGTFGGSVNFTWSGTVLVATSASFGGIAYTYGTPLTNGALSILNPAATYTVSGTIPASFQSNYFGVPTITDASSATLATAATVTIAGAPVAAGSLTITNPYSLWVSGGGSLFAGAVTMSSTLTVSGSGAVNLGSGTTTVGTLTQSTVNAAASFAGYPVITGVNQGGEPASSTVLDFSSGVARWFSYGANTSTNGEFAFYSQRSNGTNNIIVGITDTVGNITWNQNLSVAGTSTLSGNATVGSTGTGAVNNTLNVSGSNASGNGPFALFQDPSGVIGRIGSSGGILGDANRNYALLSGNSMVFYTNAAALALTLDTSQHVLGASTTDTTSATTGAMQLAGGLGIAKSVFVGGTTDSTGVGSGSLQVSGGAAIAKNLYALHLGGDSATPGIAAGTGAGTSPGSIIVTGTDTDGVITVVTGSAPAGSSATIVTVTFNVSYPGGATPIAILAPASTTASALSGVTAIHTTAGSTNFTITSGATGLAASTTYNWFYHVLD